MDLTQYPDSSEVENRLRSIAFWPNGDNNDPQVLRAKSQTVIAAAAAADEWETLTGWHPFLADADATVRYFDGTDHNGLLDLEGGALEVSSVSLSGTVQETSQWWAMPRNATSRRRPYTRLQLLSPIGPLWNYDSAGRIAITARWGYCETLPADVWSAILDRATLISLLSVENPRDVSNLGQDSFSIAFDPVGPIDPKTVLSTLGKDFPKIAARYARVVV